MKFGQLSPTGRLITLTPLIDVVFILLVFFMLASSYLDWRSIDLTVSSGAGAATSAQRAILINLRSDGNGEIDRIHVDGEEFWQRGLPHESTE